VVVLQRLPRHRGREAVRGRRLVLPAGFGKQKGHYLIYALADLDAKTKTAYSVIDRANVDLLQAYLPLVAAQKPADPRPLQLLALLQKGKLPRPHRLLPGAVRVTTEPFSIAFGPNTLAQASADARTWKARLRGDDFALDLTLAQPEGQRPAMRVGGEGKTGLSRPDDMYYLSLTRMDARGTLTRRGGKSEAVTGTGWLDRQWGVRGWSGTTAGTGSAFSSTTART
jgi:hypothetical protein